MEGVLIAAFGVVLIILHRPYERAMWSSSCTTPS